MERHNSFAYSTDGEGNEQEDADNTRTGTVYAVQSEQGSPTKVIVSQSTVADSWDIEVSSSPTPPEARQERGKAAGCSCLLGRKVLTFSTIVLLLLIGVLAVLIVMKRSETSEVSQAKPPPTASTPQPTEDYITDPWHWPEGNITVGAYYYPWYEDDFHQGAGYMREQLVTRQLPTLGEYDDSDPATIAQHLDWSRQANIRLWVSSWWGPNRREDNTIKDAILTHRDLGEHKIALFYETTGRIKSSDGYSTHNVIPDIEYISKTYFDHPNYYRIDDRPVLFVYLTRKLESVGILDDVIAEMRQAATNEGHDIYIVGDQAFQRAPSDALAYSPFAVLDAVTNYDVYGSMGAPSPYAEESGVTKHFENCRQWRDRAAERNCAYIPSASPGYNDLGVRPEKQHGPLSRKLSESDEPGSLFRVGLQYARQLVAPSTGNLLMINSFNEWHEDTQIEPVVGATTSLPDSVTYGLAYEGYGELYLNILRNETKA